MKVKVKKDEFKKNEIKKIKEEMKTRMKEKLDERKTQKCFFERDSVLKNTEEAKKDQKRKLDFSTFFERRNEKKEILQERRKLCFCQNARIIFKSI